jgi:ankyrin repeat protein
MGRGLFIAPLVLGLLVDLLPVSAAPLHEAAKAGEVEEAERLIQAGANLEALDEDGETPLTAAALAGQSAVVKLLFARGADIKGRNKGGFTLLHAAAYSGHAEIVEFALDRGAGIDDQENKAEITPLHNKAEITPLHAAAERNYLDVVRLLIERGARLHLKELNGWTPVTRATFKAHNEVVKLLREHGATCDPPNLVGENNFRFCMNAGG